MLYEDGLYLLRNLLCFHSRETEAPRNIRDSIYKLMFECLAFLKNSYPTERKSPKFNTLVEVDSYVYTSIDKSIEELKEINKQSEVYICTSEDINFSYTDINSIRNFRYKLHISKNGYGISLSKFLANLSKKQKSSLMRKGTWIEREKEIIVKLDDIDKYERINN